MLTQKLAIVGGGVGMLSILDHIYSMSDSKFEIYVFMENTTGVGEAYKQAPDEFIMNTRNDSISFLNHINDFQDWIACNHPTLSSTDYFVPLKSINVTSNDGSTLVDANFKACSKRNLYILGPATNIDNYFTEVSSLTYLHAKEAVSDFLSINFGESK